MKKGFTLIEMVLVIAIIGLLGALTVPLYQSFQVVTNRQSITSELVASLRRAKLKAIAADSDSSWGVAIGANQKITIFKGADFQNRDQNFDEVADIPANVSIESTISQIIFSKESGIPDTSGPVTLRDATGQSQDLTITPQGTVDY